MGMAGTVVMVRVYLACPQALSRELCCCSSYTTKPKHREEAPSPNPRDFRPTATMPAGATRSYLFSAGKRDPELIVLMGIMGFAYSMSGWYLGKKPTSATSEEAVAVARDQNVWNYNDDRGTEWKYKYYPGGDRTQEPKMAPSALYSVIVPEVGATRGQHERFNKFGRKDFRD